MTKVFAALVTWAILVPSAFAQDARPGNGLEAGGDLRVRVVLDTLSEDAVRIGLNRDALELRCKQALERSGLTAMDDETWSGHPYASELFITVRVEGLTYDCAAEFRRSVSYTAGLSAYVVIVPTWRRSLAETRVTQLSYVAKVFPSWRGRSHEPGARVGHAAYVVDAVLGLVDEFCGDFLAANPR